MNITSNQRTKRMLWRWLMRRPRFNGRNMLTMYASLLSKDKAEQ